jgi:hypothetical protein
MGNISAGKITSKASIPFRNTTQDDALAGGDGGYEDDDYEDDDYEEEEEEEEEVDLPEAR